MERDDNSDWKQQQDEQEQWEKECSAVFCSFDQDFSKFVAQQERLPTGKTVVTAE